MDTACARFCTVREQGAHIRMSGYPCNPTLSPRRRSEILWEQAFTLGISMLLTVLVCELTTAYGNNRSKKVLLESSPIGEPQLIRF